MRNKARKQNLEKNGNGSTSHYRIKGRGKVEEVQSVEVTALSVEDLEQLGFDTAKVTTQDLQNIAYKMDLSETFWIELARQAEKYGLQKNTNTKNQ